jgi:plastocyanin
MDRSAVASQEVQGQLGRRRLLSLLGVGAVLASAGPLVTACGGGAAGGQSYTVNMTDSLKFDPDNLTVPKGTTVTWKNTSSIAHTATDDPAKAQNKGDAVLPAGAKPWDSGNVDPGRSWSYTFDTLGQYTYFCIPHELAGMIGHITVTG